MNFNAQELKDLHNHILAKVAANCSGSCLLLLCKYVIIYSY